MHSTFCIIHKENKYKSKILNENQILKINQLLEKRFRESLSWNLIFSPKLYGYSFKNMLYIVNHNKPPFLITIKCNEGNIFGVFINNNLLKNKKSFGLSTTALFKYKKGNFKFFPSTVLNTSYCFSMDTYIAFGCSNNVYGLLINEDLKSGEWNKVNTFNNDEMKNKIFTIEELEIFSLNL